MARDATSIATWQGRRYEPRVTLFRHRDQGGRAQPVDLTPFCADLSSRKDIRAAGTFSLTLKDRALSGGRFRGRYDWVEETDDDDWVLLEIRDGELTVPVMLGLLDARERDWRSSGQGGSSTSYTVSGADFGRAFESELIALPTLDFEGSLGMGPFYAGLSEVAAAGLGAHPGVVVRRLADYLLRAGRPAGSRRLFAVPDSATVFVRNTSLAPGTAQLSDVLAWDVDDPIDGALVISDLWAGVSPHGARIADVLRTFSNEPWCELFWDLRPVSLPGVTLSTLSGTIAPEFDLRPTITLRERPFPADPASTPDRSAERLPTGRWRSLPTTRIPWVGGVESVQLGRSGQERFTAFLASHAGYGGADPYAIASALSASAEDRWNAIPCLDEAAAEIHGWRLHEVPSRYLPLTADGDKSMVRFFLDFTYLLRDWFGLNPRYLSGTVKLPRALPGVRVGERLVLTDSPWGTLYSYIEGVSHALRSSGDGRWHGTTTLTTTRGSPDETAYARRPPPSLRSILSGVRVDPARFGSRLDVFDR